MNENETQSSLTVDLTLEPKDYMVTSVEQGGKCIPGFGDHGTQYGWNLGILFLKRFIVVYDFKSEKLGFVRHREN